MMDAAMIQFHKLLRYSSSQIQILIVSDSVLCGNNTFNFNVNSSNVSTFWDFGDGNQSNLSNPSHNYQSPGIYNVVLTVTSLTMDVLIQIALVESLIGTYKQCDTIYL